MISRIRPAICLLLRPVLLRTRLVEVRFFVVVLLCVFNQITVSQIDGVVALSLVALSRLQIFAQSTLARQPHRIDDEAFGLDLLPFEAVYSKDHTLGGIAYVTLEKRLVLLGSLWQE